MNIIKRVYNWFNKNMPPPVITLANILIDLNGATGVGEWVRMPGYFAISSPPIDANASLNFLAPTGGILLVVFVNQRTAEIRSYVAKFTDDPIRTQLWQN